MSKVFETKEDLEREHLAIALFCKKFIAKWSKLEKFDIDYKVTRDGRVCYVEVKGRNRTMSDAYPLPLAARKMVKLVDKGEQSIIIWDCLDGLIYGNTSHIFSKGKMGGRKPREGSSNDKEYMLYFDEQDGLFTISKD
jgi:hypothetical protein|tara:strand:- start:226 stop:639 length:414 start_codon:yes stop_codon:yes gene_type:complete